MKQSMRFSPLAFMACLLAIPAWADDHADVLAANRAFDRALSERNIATLEPLWAHDGTATIIHPSSKVPLAGWEAVRKSWAEGALARFSELSVSMDAPHVHVIGNTAVVVGIEIVRGKRANNGEGVEFSALTTNVYEKRNGRWLMVHHHGSRVP